ncbi:MAG: wax ester/triacylglycerol synthase domain-containing protein [Gemmatimonadales bacterium]
MIATRPGRAPATPFNRPITPHRRFAFRSVDLDTVKAVKNAFGVSVNDVVMAMCAGALRRWLIDHDALPDQPLIAMIPVSVRDPASQGALGNKVSAMLGPEHHPGGPPRPVALRPGQLPRAGPRHRYAGRLPDRRACPAGRGGRETHRQRPPMRMARNGDGDARAILPGGAAAPARIPAEIFAPAVDTFAVIGGVLRAITVIEALLTGLDLAAVRRSVPL